MSDPRAPNRSELARIFTDQRTLRAFERIFDLIPSELEAIAIQAALASATANATETELGRLADSLEALVLGLKDSSTEIELARVAGALEVLAMTPRSEPTRQLLADYIDFAERPPHADKPARLAWNADDDTLNIHHTGGVTQQTGLETYARVLNSTGATIANGAVVGFDGVTSGTVKGAKYLANGATPIGYLIGLATQDILNGQIGRVTIYGMVRNIDTSAFAVGDIVYASPTTAGAMTNVRPAPPDYTIPIGVVVVSNATTGSVLVRPILELTRRFTVAFKTTNQSPAAINTAYTVTFDSLGSTQGFTIGTPSSRIVAAASGLYNVGGQFQLTSGSASVKNVWLWFRKNGVDVANSALKVSLESATAVNTQFRGIFFSLSAGDYIEVAWASDSTNVTLSAIPATGFAPAAPAVAMTITQVQ